MKITTSNRRINYTIKYLSYKAANKIKPLWLELEKHHDELDTAPNQTPRELETRWEANRAVWRSMSMMFVAAYNYAQEIVGYARVTIDKPTRSKSTKVVGFVSAMFVQERYRSQGIGGLLLSASIKWLKEQLPANSLIRLYVVKGNEQVLKFYEKYGFKVIATTVEEGGGYTLELQTNQT